MAITTNTKVFENMDRTRARQTKQSKSNCQFLTVNNLCGAFLMSFYIIQKAIGLWNVALFSCLSTQITEIFIYLINMGVFLITSKKCMNLIINLYPASTRLFFHTSIFHHLPCPIPTTPFSSHCIHI